LPFIDSVTTDPKSMSK